MKKWKSDQNERNVTLSATIITQPKSRVFDMWKVSVPKLSKTKTNKIQKLVILNLPRINVHNLNPLPPNVQSTFSVASLSMDGSPKCNKER